jgi:hypothetical protein
MTSHLSGRKQFRRVKWRSISLAQWTAQCGGIINHPCLSFVNTMLPSTIAQPGLRGKALGKARKETL